MEEFILINHVKLTKDYKDAFFQTCPVKPNLIRLRGDPDCTHSIK